MRLRNVALRLNVFVNYHPAMQRQTESPRATSDVIFCFCLASLQYLLSQRVISNAKWYHGCCASHTLLRSWQSGSYQHRWKHISGATSIAFIYVFVSSWRMKILRTQWLGSKFCAAACMYDITFGAISLSKFGWCNGTYVVVLAVVGTVMLWCNMCNVWRDRATKGCEQICSKSCQRTREWAGVFGWTPRITVVS